MPFLKFAFDELDKDHGSVEKFLKSRLTLTDDDINLLCEQYTEKNNY